MSAFRPLPFQYQQRGPELAKAQGDQLARYTEQRDQDLENYLANRSGGLRTYYYIIGPEGSVGADEVDFLASSASSYDITDGINAAIAAGAANPLNTAIIFLLPGAYTFSPITVSDSNMGVAFIASPVAQAVCSSPTDPAITGGSTLVLVDVVFGNVGGGLCWAPSNSFFSTLSIHMSALGSTSALGGVSAPGGLGVKMASTGGSSTGMAGDITSVEASFIDLTNTTYSGTISSGTNVGLSMQSSTLNGSVIAGGVVTVSAQDCKFNSLGDTILEASGNVIVSSSDTVWDVSLYDDTLFVAGGLLLTHCVGDHFKAYEVGVVDGTALPGVDAAVTFGNCSFYRPDSTSFTEPMLTLSAGASYNFLTGNSFRESQIATGQVMLRIEGDENVVSGNYFRNASASPTDIEIVSGADNNAIRKNSGNDAGLLPYITDAGTGTVID